MTERKNFTPSLFESIMSYVELPYPLFKFVHRVALRAGASGGTRALDGGNLLL
jgi:hypothetical protein